MCDSDSDVEILDFEYGMTLQQNTIKNLEKELQIVITNSSYYQQQIQELLAEKNSFKLRIEELEQLNEILEKKNQNAIQTNEGIIKEYTLESQKNEEMLKLDFENYITQLKSEFEKIISKQGEQINEYVKKIELSEEESQILQNKLITSELLNCKLQQNLQEIQIEISRKVETKKCVQQFNEKLMGENINNLNKIESLSMQVDNLEEKLQKITQQRDHFKKQFVDVSQKIISYQQELQLISTQKQELKIKLDNTIMQLKQTQMILKENIDENKKFKIIIGQYQSQIEDYRYKQDLYIKENSNLKHQMIELQTVFKEQIGALQITLSNKDQQIQQLTDPDKLTLKKIQKQNQATLRIEKQEQDKRNFIEKQIQNQH